MPKIPAKLPRKRLRISHHASPLGVAGFDSVDMKDFPSSTVLFSGEILAVTPTVRELYVGWESLKIGVSPREFVCTGSWADILAA